MVFKIGAHVSISGGFAKALEREENLNGNCGQIFVKSPRSWSFPTLKQEEIERFKRDYENSDVKPFVVHATYLINLASPKQDLFEHSIECLRGELIRADKLGLPYVIFHPGNHTGSGEETGIKRIITGLNHLKDTLGEIETELLLENTAGEGTSLGYSMKQLQKMMQGAASDNIQICLDTAHAFSAGYALHMKNGIQDMIGEIKRTFGMKKIKILHLNDSKAELGSRNDEHAHLGEGEMGRDGIKRFINHEAFRDLPMIRESPVSARDIEAARELRKEE